VQPKAFENVKNQLSYCGIWCGSCIVGNGMLKELTKKYERLIDGYGVDKWGAKEQDFDGPEFMKSLKAIQNIPICRGCLKGGGNDVCKIRPCAQKKKLYDCMECGEMESCSNHESIKTVREGAISVGMLAKDENDHSNHQQIIKKWTAEIKNKCLICGI
jgi:hypothetical protein